MRIERTLEKRSEPEILGDYGEIPALCGKGHVDRIIVALDERRGKFPVEQLLLCRLKGIRVDDGAPFTAGMGPEQHFLRAPGFMRRAGRCGV